MFSFVLYFVFVTPAQFTQLFTIILKMFSLTGFYNYTEDVLVDGLALTIYHHRFTRAAPIQVLKESWSVDMLRPSTLIQDSLNHGAGTTHTKCCRLIHLTRCLRTMRAVTLNMRPGSFACVSTWLGEGRGAREVLWLEQVGFLNFITLNSMFGVSLV